MAKRTKKDLLAEAKADSTLRSLKQGKQDTDRKYRALQDELLKTQKALDDALGHQRYRPKRIKISARKTVGGNATAFALASDWHVEEVVPKHKVNGLNEYNPDIAKKRAMRFFELVLKFLRVERQESKVDNLVLWLGGDFFSGDLGHGTPTAFPPIIAAQYAEDLIVSGITFLLEQEPNLHIKCVGSVGNHSRMLIGKPVNVALEQELSLEWMMYHHIAKHFAGQVEFQLDNSFHSYVNVYGKTIRFNHGHQGFRYNKGQAGLHGPLFKAIREVWDLQIKADMTCIGHYHTYTPAATLLSRNYCVNGSLIGDTPYGAMIGHEDPIQAFFMIHDKYGLVGQRPLFVAK